MRPNQLRSEKEITRLLRVHVFPAWGGRPFLGIRRSDVAALLDHVQDNHSARQADYVLNVVRSVMNRTRPGTTITCRPSSGACGAKSGRAGPGPHPRR